jgi:signal transduction histidine kinase
MLPNETTTRSEVVTPPDRIEALVVALSRDAARPLVTFLRQEKVNVTVVQDAEAAFEEALLHRPNLVLIDEGLPVALCERLKANGRTHFLPAIIFASGSWEQRPAQRLLAIQAGADALFSVGNDEESRARLWALLRSDAVHRRQDRKQKVQGSALKERGRWLETFVHDLQNSVGALQANFEFLGQTALARSAEMSEDVSDCVRETRSLLQQVTRGLRTVQDFERFESGRVRPRKVALDLHELLTEVKEDVLWQVGTGAASAPLSHEGVSVGLGVGLGEPLAPAVRLQLDQSSPAVTVLADRDLLRQALGALCAYLLRLPGATQLSLQVAVSDTGVSVDLVSDGPALSAEDQERLFEPYARWSRRTALAQGIALAHARAILELHGGTVRATNEGGDRAAFVVELKSRDPSPNHHMGR